MHSILSRLIPFIIIGMLAVIFTIGIMLFAYLFLFGAIIGFILFIIAWLRAKLFPQKTQPSPKHSPGRIIDSNDWKEL